MKLVKYYNDFFQKYFPTPFTIAILLSLFSFIIAFLFTRGSMGIVDYTVELMGFWYNGLFKSSLLEFTVHMMLILVLGHIIALSRPAEWIIDKMLRFCNSSASSVLFVAVFAILISLYNWGLGLVFSAIFARKIGKKFQRKKQLLNYPLVVAAAYMGMMVWHGGLSGSATLTIAGDTHSYVNQIGVIPLGKTTFSAMNLFVSALLIVILPGSLYFLAKKNKSEQVPNSLRVPNSPSVSEESPAEKFEKKPYLSIIFGGTLLVYFILIALERLNSGASFLAILNLQSTNLLLLGLAIVLHGNVSNFLAALENAIGDVSGILIQFPLYFGIMGLIQGSGLALLIADLFTSISNDLSLPIFTFFSAGILNIFIPSGGGQWQVQAPIIIASAENSGVSIEKLILAMCYGDQLTNMLQPFWALPILSICQLKAKDILPYCLFIFALGFSIFLTALLIF